MISHAIAPAFLLGAVSGFVAVPMGRIIAATLGGDLDVVLVRKLGAPYNPELAIGAVDEAGRLVGVLTERTLASAADEAAGGLA